MQKYWIFILAGLFLNTIHCKADTLPEAFDYSFIIQDRPSQLFTMRQSNQDYLSAYRLFARGLNRVSKSEKVSKYVQIGLQALFFMPLSHEEGHRSILTANNIGAVSQPYFNKHGAAYVKGVSNQTLQNLRDTDLPSYIRLHTAGLESDYMLTKRMENIASFQKDKFENYKWEYYMRKVAILQYYMSGLFKMEMSLKEESNELERDIVGHDVYGAARHLFRPTMVFYRYTNYRDLTSQEKNYVTKMGYKSLLNLCNPLIFGKEHFKLNDNVFYNFGLGHAMAPFGDFIDETFWLKYKDLNAMVYFRQFQNRTNWFHGFGASLDGLALTRQLYVGIAGHIWQQPEKLDFNTNKKKNGGALDLDFKYFFPNNKLHGFRGFSVDLGMIYKTYGFLPEEVYLNEYFGIRIGTTIRI